jgi:putative transcriptional regulator
LLIRTPCFAFLLSTGLALAAPASAATHTASIPKERQPGPSERVVPERGVFLVAKRGLSDPRFQQTVVLVLAHGDSGTLGVIINRPTELELSRVLPDLEVPDKEPHTLFFGGPVGLNVLLFLTRSVTPPARTQNVMADVYFGADRDTLAALLHQHKGARELRMYVGHSGWAPGQLAAEIARGDWLLVHGDPQTVFDKDQKNIWPELMRQHPAPPMTIQIPRPWRTARAGSLTH